ncbi:MAG: hypothetical protein ABIJ97_06495, partial [Bacteroidota bacterium]
NFLEAESRDIQEIIHRFFVDKNGLPINKDTVETYMRESKEERRAKGKRRVDISDYFEDE